VLLNFVLYMKGCRETKKVQEYWVRAVFLNRWVATHFWVAGTHFCVPQNCFICSYFCIKRVFKFCFILFCGSPTTRCWEPRGFRGSKLQTSITILRSILSTLQQSRLSCLFRGTAYENNILGPENFWITIQHWKKEWK